VNFSDTLVAQYAREIAADERAHVAFLRTALGNSTVAQPTIDIDVTPTSAFSNAARAAGLIGAGQAFDVYANDENFLLGAYIFEDVGVTAYKGAAPLITSKTLVEASAGILAAEAYHAGLIRTVLFARGLQTPSTLQASEAISNARDSLDGPADLDQGVSPQKRSVRDGIEHRAGQCERHRVQPHRRTGAQHRLLDPSGCGDGRVLPERVEWTHSKPALRIDLGTCGARPSGSLKGKI
jgi:hypothetical protein